MDMSYTPNFSDPRVKSRCLGALEFVEQYVKSTQSHWLSSREIQKHTGSLSRPLGKFLKDALLICTDSYYNIQTGQCKKYTSNPDGIRHIKQQLGIVSVQINITNRLQDELDTGEFVYTEKSNRIHHPLQRLPKRIKLPILRNHNYRHEYDIQCCVHRLILQHAQAKGLSKPTPALVEYISDRTAVRQRLAFECGITPQQVKQVLTAMIQGGTLSSFHENRIFAELNYNKTSLSNLQVNPYILQFKEECRDIWKTIKPTLNVGTRRLTGKDKSELYRVLEESVRVVIVRSLKRDKNKHFFEHDGWSSQRAVDIDRLIYEVKQQTGFAIELEWTIHEYVDSY
jgi:hypothetical protein